MFNFKRLSALIAVILIITASLFGIATSRKVSAAGTRQKLFILVPGFNTDTSSPNGFTKILGVLNQKYPGLAAITYSYQGLNNSYNKLETVVQSISQDVSFLNDYTAVQNRDIYIIGHSLGGVIAASYASQFSGFPSADNTRLAGIIALDSPLNGISQDSNVASCYPQALSWLSAIVGRQNLPIISELTPGNAEVNGIQTASQHVPVLSIGSADDCFIPPADTSIVGGQNSIVHSGGTPGDIDSLHGAVRNDDRYITLPPLYNSFSSHFTYDPPHQ